MLTATESVDYLISQGLLSAADVVFGRLQCTSVGRRNCNFLVNGSAAGFFLKHGVHRGRVGSIENEAAVYQTLCSDRASSRLVRRFLPAFHGFDQQRRILALEASGAEDLQQYHIRTGRFPRSLARELGEALGRLHSATSAWRGDRSPFSRLTSAEANVLDLHQPPLAILTAISAAGVELLKLIRRHSQFGAGFEAIRADWRCESLIHCDMKLANCMVCRRRGGRHGVKLIDWEYAGFGDPRWDVGAVFAGYWSMWVLSRPPRWTDLHDEQADSARLPLTRITPALRAFWNSYCIAAEIPPSEQSARLLAAVRCSAARLVQTVYEFAQNAHQLDAELRHLLQLSLNIFERPEQAAADLLGIPVEASDAS